MFGDITVWILEFIRLHGVLGVVIGVLMEAIIVPIPSPIVMMTAGFVLIEPGLALSAALWKILLIITIPASIAGLIGNYVVYAVCYFGGKPVIDKFKKFLGFSWSDIRKVRRKFGTGKKRNFSLVALRAIPIVPLSVVSAGAGVMKIDWKKFGLFSFIGLLPRNFVLAFIGWKLSEVYVSIADKVNDLETMVTITLVGIILLIIVLHKFRILNKIEGLALK